jgi:hypothetical protein
MRFEILPVVLLASVRGMAAAELFLEPFDSEATAKVMVLKDVQSAAAFVDYSNYVRSMPGTSGPVTIRIPEAPNRLPGSQPTRGVALSALYSGTPRAINLIAAAAANGAAVPFSGDHRLKFDLWLSMDPSATTSSTGTTESALWGINGLDTVLLSRSNRTNGRGIWGWLTNEGGAGAAAGSGDASLYFNNGELVQRENIGDAARFSLAFAQGSPIPNTPNNQWSAVEVDVIGTRTVVRINGVVFFDEDPGGQDPDTSSGVARIGYEDLFTGSTAFSPNWIFGLFDNFVVESLTGTPSLAIAPSTAFPPAISPGESPVGTFEVTNAGLESFSITAATIEGADASQFTLDTPLPMTVPSGSGDTLSITFNPQTPNGLKVARLLVSTDDPAVPQLSLPLQARRQIFTIEGSVTSPIGTVITEAGSSTGEITLTNQNAGPVNITTFTPSGANAADFSVAPVPPISIESGGSAVFTVTFAPTGERGVRSALLEFSTSDAGSPTLSFPVRARYTYGPPLIAHYKMDDSTGTSLADATGNGATARLEVREAPFGFSQPSLLPGGAGTSVRFLPADATTTGNFSVSTAPHLPTVSYALWVRPEAKPSIRRLLHRSSIFTNPGTLHSLYLTGEGRVVFEVNSTLSVESEDAAAPDDTNTHIIVSHVDTDGFGNTTGGQTQLFINGQPVAENLDAPGQTDYSLTTLAEGLYIASSTGANLQGYLGGMDDLQVYSTAISPAQAAVLFANPGMTLDDLSGAPFDFKITSFSFDPAARTASLSWNSRPGKTYDVHTSSSLTATGPDGWTLLVANQPSGGTSTTFIETDVPATEQVRYYRITED